MTDESALADARRAEEELAAGRWRGSLHGIPIALKDNIDTAGLRTTAASAVLENRVPTEDAEVVRRLREAGAVFLGKLNVHEFGMGATSTISRFGAVRNPWAQDRMTGGSSGGSAAAVAAGFCFGALGTDTGGSIRIPAACCGVVGWKPSYGVVSAAGVVPLSTSLDHVGPLCRTATDAALLFRALTDHPVAQACDPERPPPVADLRIGVLPTSLAYCDRPAEPEIQAAFDAALDILRPLVADLRAAELAVPDIGAIIEAEAYAYHATCLATTPELYDPRTREALLSGRATTPAEYAELRRRLAEYRASVHREFESADLMVVPTLTEFPLPIVDATDPFAGAACTFVFNVGGLPSVTVPCGVSRAGLPIGLMISGPPLGDANVLALARAYENAVGQAWRSPPLRD